MGKISCALTLSYFFIGSDFFHRHHGGQLTTLHSMSCFLSCVCFSNHSNEYTNEIIECSHAGFNVSVDNIFTKEVLMINTWGWAFLYEDQWSLMNTMTTQCSDNGNMFVVSIGCCWISLCLEFKDDTKLITKDGHMYLIILIWNIIIIYEKK